MQQKAGKYFVIRRRCINCEGSCKQLSTWGPDSTSLRGMSLSNVRALAPAPFYMVIGQGPQFLESRAQGQGQAATGGETVLLLQRQDDKVPSGAIPGTGP